MKIIDLFNKIANGEEAPMRIIYKDDIYVFNISTNQYYKGDDLLEINTYYKNSLKERLYNFDMLNDEVEIPNEPKEDKIEKLNLKVDTWCNPSQCDLALGKKIDEIIDKVNSI